MQQTLYPYTNPDLSLENSISSNKTENSIKEEKPNKCFQSWDIPQIWEQEELNSVNFKNVAYQNIELATKLNTPLTEDLSIKIPHISHHVWFTNSKRPMEMPTQDREILSKKIITLNSHDGDWNSILWTNDPSKIPLTVKQAKNLDMQIRDIHDSDSPFVCLIDGLLENKQFGLATDIWRLIAVKQEGGFYSDNDYTLYIDIDSLTKTFNSFFGFDDAAERYTGNAIIAASKDHPIISEAYDMLCRNTMSDNRPDYIKYPCNLFAKTITGTGPALLALAIHKAANKNDNIDIVFPHGVIFFAPNTEFSNPFKIVDGHCPHYCFDELFYTFQESLKCTDLQSALISVGNDAYSGSWIQQDVFWEKLTGKQKPLFVEYCDN